MSTPSLRTRSLGLAVVLLAGAGCHPYPRDPDHALEQVLERGTLRVGVEPSGPWVTGQPPGQPGGVEGTLLADFADEVGVDVDWRWGSAEEHFDALMHQDLDVAIGGVTTSNPWKKHVGFTLPYYTSRTVVGVPASGPMLSDLEGVSVAVRKGSGVRDLLEDRGARVVVRDTFAGSDGPVAAEAWEIEGMGLRPTAIRLRTDPHVMAVPPGENALLMRLEDFLLRRADETWVAARLREAARP